MIERRQPAAIVRPADPVELLRCTCPTCIVLDAMFPGQGYQLALFRYVPIRRPFRR